MAIVHRVVACLPAQKGAFVDLTEYESELEHKVKGRY